MEARRQSGRPTLCSDEAGGRWSGGSTGCPGEVWWKVGLIPPAEDRPHFTSTGLGFVGLALRSPQRCFWQYSDLIGFVYQKGNAGVTAWDRAQKRLAEPKQAANVGIIFNFQKSTEALYS